MATQQERTAVLEEKVKALQDAKPVGWVIFSALVGACVLWLAYITVTINGIGQRLSRMEGKVGDPLSVTVKNLTQPSSKPELAANLSLLSAQIGVDRAKKVKPRVDNVQTLAGTLAHVANDNPDLPEAWQAVAELASYRTASLLTNSGELPECDVSQPPHMVTPAEIPEAPPEIVGTSSRGYIFRNCKLYMDHLPVGTLVRGAVTDPGPYHGWQVVQVAIAYAIHCVIILNDSGIAESGIMQFDAIDCRLEYRINRVPPTRTQKLLLASLEHTVPGRFSLNLM